MLADGWEAAGVAPGSVDHTLEGVSLEPVVGPPTTGSLLALPGTGADLDAQDWWFRCRFDAAAAGNDEEIVLRCAGIATLGEVWLNGKLVLETDDMHLAYEAPVTDQVGADNELVIGVRALAPVLAVRRPRPRWRTRLVRDQSLRWIRTALVGRIPAFAPGPAPVGPFLPVSLVRRRRLAFDAVHIRASVTDGGEGSVEASAHLRQLGDFSPRDAILRISGPTGTTEHPLDLTTGDGAFQVGGRASLLEVALWWPHTHGDQPLYAVSIIVRNGATEISSEPVSVGFRHARAPADEPRLRA